MVNGQLGQTLPQLGFGRNCKDLSDGQLLERFTSFQDEAAFATLVQRHGPMVLGVCQRLLNEPHDAEDAFQATFLVLVRKAGTIAQPDLLANWLYGVAYRIAIKARATAARRREHERQAALMPLADPIPNVAWRELRTVLDAEMNLLPEKYRAPLVLCYLEGLTNEEAARKLGWPTGSMSGRLSRGRELLRKRLIRRGLTLSAGLLALLLSKSSASAAAIPAALAKSTVSLAVLSATGQSAAGGGVSATVAGLIEEGMSALESITPITKVSKFKAHVLLAIFMIVLSVGAIAYGALVGGPTGKYGPIQHCPPSDR